MTILHFNAAFRRFGDPGDPPANPPAGDPPADPPSGGDPFQSLPDNLRNDPSIVKYGNDFVKLAEGHVSLAKMLGDTEGRVKLPAPDDAEGQRALLQQMGLPAEPSEYELPFGDDMPEGFDPKGEMASLFRDLSYQAGVLPKQAGAIAEGVVKKLAEMRQGQSQAQEAQQAEWYAEVVKSWGKEDSPSFKQHQAFAAKASSALTEQVLGRPPQEGEQTVSQVLDAAGLGSHPLIVKMMSHLGEKMFAEQNNGQLPQSTGGSMTREQALARAQDLNRQAIMEKNPMEAIRLGQEAQKMFAMVEKVG